MFGKFFASTFTGSMFGAGADVFAVWGYVIANTVRSQVELNPRVIAASVGMTVERAQAAIAVLCQPDPGSRSKNDDGRRLIKEGEYAYRVPNHNKYRLMRCEEDRRAYNREAQRKHREKKRSSAVNKRIIDGQSQSSVSAQAEADTEAEAKEQEPRAREVGNSAEPTAAGLACKAIMAAGIIPNPSHAGLLAAIAEGATTQEFADAAAECKAKGKDFPYLIAMVRGRRRETAAPVKPQPQPVPASREPAKSDRRLTDEQRKKTLGDNLPVVLEQLGIPRS